MPDIQPAEPDAARVYALVRDIPRGKVRSYGAVGDSLSPRVDARTVGRIMAFSPPEIPWWRVLASDGQLSIAKRNPALAVEQRRRLEAEGVQFTADGTVEMRQYSADTEERGQPGFDF